MILSYKVNFFYTPGASLFCCCFFLWFCFFFFKEEEEEGSGHICLIEKDACFLKKTIVLSVLDQKQAEKKHSILMSKAKLL